MNLSKAHAPIVAGISTAFLPAGGVAAADERDVLASERPKTDPPGDDCWRPDRYREDKLCIRFCRAEYLDCLGYERDRVDGPYPEDYVSGLESRCYRKYLRCRNGCYFDIYLDRYLQVGAGQSMTGFRWDGAPGMRTNPSTAITTARGTGKLRPGPRAAGALQPSGVHGAIVIRLQRMFEKNMHCAQPGISPIGARDIDTTTAPPHGTHRALFNRWSAIGNLQRAWRKARIPAEQGDGS